MARMLIDTYDDGDAQAKAALLTDALDPVANPDTDEPLYALRTRTGGERVAFAVPDSVSSAAALDADAAKTYDERDEGQGAGYGSLSRRAH